MKKLFLVLMLLVMVCPFVMAKKESSLVPEYQIQGAGMTSQNAQQVCVTIFSKNKDVSDAEFEKAAVHGILFRDYDDTTNTGHGSVASHKAIMSDPTAEAQYKDFFEPFFKNGDYKNYVQIVSNTRRVVKSGKEWKISAIVAVNSTQLKKVLKKQGMVKGLGDGW